MHVQRYASIVVALALLVFESGGLTASARLAPNVSLPDAEGAMVQLASYKGKVVLVDFWASWCVPCQQSFPEIDAIFRDFQSRGVEVLAVNLDERRRDADAFLARHPHHLTVLFDPKGGSAEAFGVEGMPSSFLIDRSGNIRFTHTGYSGSVRERYRKEIAQLLAEREEP